VGTRDGYGTVRESQWEPIVRRVLLSSSRIEAERGIGLESGGEVNVLGSQLVTGGKIEARSAGDMNLASLRNREEGELWYASAAFPIFPMLLGRKSGVGKDALVGTELTAGAGVRLESGGEAMLGGVVIGSGGNLELEARGDIGVFGTLLEDRTNERNFRHEQAVSRLTTEGDTRLVSGGDLAVLGGEFRSGGDVVLEAGKTLSLLSVTDRESSRRVKESTFTTTTTELEEEKVRGVEIKASNRLKLESGGDVTLESVVLEGGKGVEIRSGGALGWEMAEQGYFYSRSKERDYLNIWLKGSAKGNSMLTGIEGQLRSGGPIRVEVAKGVTVEYAQRQGETAEEALARVALENPWLSALGTKDEVVWNGKADGVRAWSDHHRGLGVLGAVIITIVTYGLAAPYINTLVSGSSTMASMTVAEKVVATSLTAMTVDTVVQFGVTGRVDGDQVLKTGLLAGLTTGITSAPIWGSEGKSLIELAGLKEGGLFSGASEGLLENLSGEKLLALGGKSVIQAGLEKAIFGTDFGDAFKASLAGDVSTLLARDIGVTWGEGKNPAVQTLAHMGLGAATAKLTGRDPASGAIGGLVESILDNAYGQAHPEVDRSLYTAGSALAAGLTADLMGKDPATAALAARNAAENNFLNHLDRAKLEELRARKDLSREEAQSLVLLEIQDRFGDELLAKLQGGQTLTQTEERNLKIFLADYASVEGDKATAALIREKIVLDDSSYPFAGSGEAKTAYVDNYMSGTSWWEWLTSWRPVSANEEAFNAARIKSGWFLNTHPNELLLPTELERLGWVSTLDALENSALAAAGYGGAKALGVDDYTSGQFAQTLSALSDIGASFGLPKAGLGVAFGETTTIKSGGTVNAVTYANISKGTLAKAVNLGTQEGSFVQNLAKPGDTVIVGTGTSTTPRLPQDVKVSPVPPRVKIPLDGRTVGGSATQNAAMQADVAYLNSIHATDIRINQQQTVGVGDNLCRLGICRPDVQARLPGGRMIYIEYDTSASTRGPDHAERLLSNNPDAIVILRRVD
jgi:hypothetical protein